MQVSQQLLYFISKLSVASLRPSRPVLLSLSDSCTPAQGPPHWPLTCPPIWPTSLPGRACLSVTGHGVQQTSPPAARCGPATAHHPFCSLPSGVPCRPYDMFCSLRRVPDGLQCSMGLLLCRSIAPSRESAWRPVLLRAWWVACAPPRSMWADGGPTACLLHAEIPHALSIFGGLVTLPWTETEYIAWPPVLLRQPAACCCPTGLQ